jgi:tRNA-2-methylthio-N6-dimethylallyladenosine synthase
MTDSVPFEVKSARFEELEQVQRSQQTRFLQRYMGREVSVLAEKLSPKSADHLTGHSTCHRVVNFAAGGDMLGKIVNVKITEVKSNSLFGELN